MYAALIWDVDVIISNCSVPLLRVDDLHLLCGCLRFVDVGKLSWVELPAYLYHFACLVQ